MTDTQLTIITQGIPGILIALGGILVALWRKVDTGTAISAANSRDIAEVNKKASIIEAQGNSAATASDGKIQKLQEQVEALTRLLAEHKEIAALLAQSVAAKEKGSHEPTRTEIVNTESNPVPITPAR